MLSISQTELELVEELVSIKQSQTELREKINKRRKILQEENINWNYKDELNTIENAAPDTIRSKHIKRIAVECLLDKFLQFPIEALLLQRRMSYSIHDYIDKYFEETKYKDIIDLLNELASTDNAIYIDSIEQVKGKKTVILEINRKRLLELVFSLSQEENITIIPQLSRKSKIRGDKELRIQKLMNSNMEEADVEDLLNRPTCKQKLKTKQTAEVIRLIHHPSVKERNARKKNKSGSRIREFCSHLTKEQCVKINGTSFKCTKIHFKKILQNHTDVALGDCSYLDTCRHMKTCKFVHYELDPDDEKKLLNMPLEPELKLTDLPAQWINCDVRKLDFSILGKFSVIMADPPWDIHMNLPYGTMSDDEMKSLNIQSLQDDGFIFLWVTGRAMELGRDILKIWGYERIEELVWVKTNQLQRIIRTGRTGHWLNHSKEHCLVGIKGNPICNRFLDCDVIVAEVRETSRKPDEIYGLIERLSTGTRKVELFGREHNIHPGWLTLGNQLKGNNIVEPDLLERVKNWEEKMKQEQKSNNDKQ